MEMQSDPMALLDSKVELVENKVEKLDLLISQILKNKEIYEKIAVLDSQQEVRQQQDLFESLMKAYGRPFDPAAEYVVKAVFALGEADIVFRFGDLEQETLSERLQQLLQQLMTVEKFYHAIGGVLGYHRWFLHLLLERPRIEGQLSYAMPDGEDLSKKTEKMDEFILWGIEGLKNTAYIFPVGGAGDRFDLRDQKTGECLPVGCLQFSGKTLLQGLFDDLLAQEYLYFSLKGEQLQTPVMMMTSPEKKNFERVKEICEQNRYFGRGKGQVVIAQQPLVPVLTEEGHWSTKGALELYLKPGGHGVIWELCLQAKVFSWFSQQGREKAVVRQINNPIAGTDYGLLAFMGKGVCEQKLFGFASCYRPVGAAEGVNVYFEHALNDQVKKGISNIEYSELKQYGIEDRPDPRNPGYSCFPANTNILYADLPAVKAITESEPLPGLMINLKHHVPFHDKTGAHQAPQGGRLESMMQNIADNLSVGMQAELPTFITYNLREKTISSTKSPFLPGSKLEGTPAGAAYTQAKNHHELLTGCGMQLPELVSEEEFIAQGLSFYLRYLPALGPLFSIISQKVQGGSIGYRSSLVLEIISLEMSNVQLDGALHVEASSPYGAVDTEGNILFSAQKQGKCSLRNVTVKNQGMQSSFWTQCWYGNVEYQEALIVELEDDAEFEAEGVTFEGHYHFAVPKGMRLRITASPEGGLSKELTPLEGQESWYWEYFVGGDQPPIGIKKLKNMSESQ